ncbi:MAG: hypothetical protein ACLGSH_10405 [Acidobacteriota bacterium]
MRTLRQICLIKKTEMQRQIKEAIAVNATTLARTKAELPPIALPAVSRAKLMV